MAVRAKKQYWKWLPIRGGEEDTWRCSRCGSMAMGRGKVGHECSLPKVRGKELIFHDVPEPWPYRSQGEDPATPKTLGRFIKRLPKAFLDEVLEYMK